MRNIRLKTLMESDFPYSDCEGYTKCLKDGLDFSDKSAITVGWLETMYQNDLNAITSTILM